MGTTKALRKQLETDFIARRAYALYETRGPEDGHDVDDWLHAERELLEQESSK